MPLISIVVNTYNGARYLPECLDSILAIDGRFPLQIIVMDDASQDDTASVLARYHDDRIQFVQHHHNKGAAEAVNTAFSLVRGTFTARIDYDDRYRPHFLLRAIEALQRNPKAGLVCGSVQMIDGDGKPCGISSPVQQGYEAGCGDHFLNLMRHYFVTAPTLLARTQIWKRAIPIPSGMNFCDWYMTLMMAEVSELCIIDDTLADYRIHPLNMHSTMVVDGTGEHTTWRVLDYFTQNSIRASELIEFKSEIYAHHAAEWGNRYFGAQMPLQARRCYLRAFSLKPRQHFRKKILWRLLGTFLGGRHYTWLKHLYRGTLKK
ncbi:MAG: glycosyltransferase [Proteobacteria bacterium]|nr:glycosyltransferase [Pseudomonadota bacterium]